MQSRTLTTVPRAGLAVAGRREALTLDERGHIQRFAVAPKELIAQVCRRQPQALTEDLRASLPLRVQAVDARGRKTGSQAMAETKP